MALFRAALTFTLPATAQTPSCSTCTDCDGDGFDAIACGGADCDDQDARRFPGAVEVCDAAGLDEDCNFDTFGSRDADGDSYVDRACFNTDRDGNIARGQDCDDSRNNINPMAPDVCNGVDDNCDGSIDDDTSIALFLDGDLDGFGDPAFSEQACPGTAGYSSLPNDCDDNNPAIKPGDQVCVNRSKCKTLICGSSGEWIEARCRRGLKCQTQTNGTGVCG